MATTIYSSANDGYITSSNANFVLARDSASGSSFSKTSTTATYGIRSDVASGRGGTTYFVARTFLDFDVSWITHIPKSATLRIRGQGNDNADVVAVRGTQSTSLALADFDSIYGWDGTSADGSGAGSNSGNVTVYGDAISWDATGFNTFTLTRKALLHISAFTTFKVCLMEEDSDLRDITPVSPWGDINYSGSRLSEYSGTSSDPLLSIVEQDNSISFGCNI